jgi:hypothetical protein
MLALIRSCARLLSFRAGGEHMPHSPTLLAMLLAVALVLDIAVTGRLPDVEASPVLKLLNLGVGLGLLFLLLQGAAKAERFVQTATALALSTLPFQLVLSPMILVLWPVRENPEQLTPLQAMVTLMMLPLFLWWLAVRIWILRGATEYRWLSVIILSMAMFVAEITITAFLAKAFQ